MKDRDRLKNPYSEVSDLVVDRLLLRYLSFCESSLLQLNGSRSLDSE